jgi:hypothetical protein
MIEDVIPKCMVIHKVNGYLIRAVKIVSRRVDIQCTVNVAVGERLNVLGQYKESI